MSKWKRIVGVFILATWACQMTVGCVAPNPPGPEPPQDLDEAPPAVYPTPDSFEPRGGLGEPCLAMLDRSASVVIFAPWHGMRTSVATAVPWSPLSWSLDAWLGPGVFALKLLYISDDMRLRYYSYRDGQVREIPYELPTESECLAAWSPSDMQVAVSSSGDVTGWLQVIDPQSGEEKWSGSHRGDWDWSPDALWLAFGAPRRIGLGWTVDLALLGAWTGTVTIARRGDAQHQWVPVGWSGYEHLAYRDAGPGAESSLPLWIEVPSLETTASEPELPLALDPEAVGKALPQDLRLSWTGRFAVDERTGLLAVVCRAQQGLPYVYVRVGEKGPWYLVGQGDRPAWSPFPLILDSGN